MKKDLISIVVPIYNVKPYINECVDSLLKQDYDNIEIILVDDGSTDGSGEIADDYAKKHKNITTLHKENGGLSSARNYGLNHAHGDWVAFVDSDDYVKSNFISSLYSLARTNKASIATCNFEAFSDDGSILKKSPSWPSKTLSGKDALDDMLLRKLPAYIWLSLFKIKLFKENNILFPDGREFEDIFARIRLLDNANKVAFTNEKLYLYRIRKDSITGKKFSEKRYKDFIYAVESVEEYLKYSNKASYFKFYSLTGQLNYLAKEKALDELEKKYWKSIRGELKSLYKKTRFPSKKLKYLYLITLWLSRSHFIYSTIYRSIKI